jgi:hypothetical protein
MNSMGGGGKSAKQDQQGLLNYTQGTLNPQLQQSGQQTAAGLESAASNPFWTQAQGNAAATAGGAQLNGSPELNKALTSNTEQALAGAANENARNTSTMEKNGMAPSVATGQANQANMAAAGAQAQNQNNQAFEQNYATERQNQINAPGQFAQAQATPLNYLSQVPTALMNPESAQGNLLSALASGGQVVDPNTLTSSSPSEMSNVLNTIGVGSSAAGSM